VGVLKKWRDMDHFSYLKWGDVIHWWGTEFAQLQQDINSERPNRLLNSLRVEKIEAAGSALVGVLAEFRNGVDNSFKWTESGLLRKMVFDRERLVSKSL
jgi:hypothetical protein